MFEIKKILAFTLISALLLSGVPFPYQTANASATVEYLVIGGGGNGGAQNDGDGGGGGAGAFRTATGYSVTEGTDYTVTVGAGGSSSVFDTIISGAGGNGGAGTGSGGGKHGGSSSDGSGGGGGGEGWNQGGGGNGGSSGAYGNDGGAGKDYLPSALPAGAGGGGGAGAVGQDGAYYIGGDGGAGKPSSISGSSVTYAGGGGGGDDGTGGAGGGGNYNQSGSANTGGGGGGARYTGGSGGGGAGGSGIVIIRYLTNSLTATGGTITTDGSYTIHTFTSSGTFSVQSPVPSPPLNPSLTTLSTSSMLFDWDAPTDGDNITGYKIWNNTDGSVILNDTATSDTQYTLTGLKSGSLQNLIVSAWNGTGAGENSTSVSNYTINTPPVLDSVNAYNSTAFELSYTINGTFNGIRIDGEEFGSSVTTLLANSTSSSATYIVGGITEAIDTAITIFALNIGGTSEVSNEITNATASTSAPSLETSQGLGSAVDLTITSPVNGTATYYDILRTNSSCTSFTTIESGVTNLTTTDSSTEPETLYCYQVVAVNQYGSTNSGNSTITTGIASSGGGSGGGGGGGGGGSPMSGNPISPVSELFELNFLSNHHFMRLGESLTDQKITLEWASNSNLIITGISVSDNGFTETGGVLQFPSTPFTLLSDATGNSVSTISYNVIVPPNVCTDANSGRVVGDQACVGINKYIIPVTITAGHEGDSLVASTNITVEIISDFDLALIFVLLAIGLPLIGYLLRKGKGRSHKISSSDVLNTHPRKK